MQGVGGIGREDGLLHGVDHRLGIVQEVTRSTVEHAGLFFAGTAIAIVPAERNQAVIVGSLADIFQVVAAEFFTTFRLVAHATHFTYVNRYALVDEVHFQLSEDVLDVIFISSLHILTGSGGVAPFGIFGRQRELGGFVEVYRHHQTVGSGVGGQGQIVDGKFSVGSIALYAQITGRVLSACGTHGIYKDLVPLVDDCILFAAIQTILAQAPIAVMQLVEGFEDEEVALVLEAGGNLRPHGSVLGCDCFVGSLVAGSFAQVQPVFGIGAIVVNVDDGVQAGILSITYDFGHTVHPFIIYLIVGSVAHMAHPSDRDADGGETGCGHTVEKSLRGRSIVPSRLVRDAVYMCIE